MMSIIKFFVLALTVLMARVSAILTEITADLTLKEAFDLYNTTTDICNEQLGYNLTVHVSVTYDIVLFLEGDNDDPDFLQKMDLFAKCMDREGRVGALKVFPGSFSSFTKFYGPFLSSADIEASNVETMDALYDDMFFAAKNDISDVTGYLQHQNMLLCQESLFKYTWYILMLLSINPRIGIARLLSMCRVQEV